MSEFSHLKNKLLAEQVEDEIYHYMLDTPLERLIPQAEILLGEYGQRIQDAAERAYAAGRIGRENYLAILAERKRREVKA